MSFSKLRVPRAHGNQPDKPPDDPLSIILAEWSKDRYICFSGYKRKPPIPCLVGARSECAWGLASSEYRYCMFYYIRESAGCGTIVDEAESLGISRERYRSLLTRASEKVRTDLNVYKYAE